jgi:hypothetical protein
MAKKRFLFCGLLFLTLALVAATVAILGALGYSGLLIRRGGNSNGAVPIAVTPTVVVDQFGIDTTFLFDFNDTLNDANGILYSMKLEPGTTFTLKLQDCQGINLEFSSTDTANVIATVDCGAQTTQVIGCQDNLFLKLKPTTVPVFFRLTCIQESQNTPSCENTTVVGPAAIAGVFGAAALVLAIVSICLFIQFVKHLKSGGYE